MAVVSGKENFEKSHEKASSAKTEKVDVDGVIGNAEIESATTEISNEAMKAIESAESSESEKTFSEKGDDKVSEPSGGGATASDDDAKNLFAHIQKNVPRTKMQKEIAAVIRKEIRKEEQKVLLAYVGVKKYPPHRLAEKIAKIRSLRDLLGSLVDATKEFLTGLYLKWVRKSV